MMLSSKRKRQSAGFTLVELMVSLVLGLLVMGAIGSVYISSKKTGSTRDALAMLQENGRIALRHLQAGIAPAGYPMGDKIFPFVNSVSALAEEGDYWRTQDSADGDRISISFSPQQDGYETDCLGVNAVDKLESEDYPDNKATLTVDGTELVVNSFFVEDGVLKCRGSGNNSAQPVAEGIDRMEVIYLTQQQDQMLMLTAAELEDEDVPGSWSDVVAVQIALLVHSIKAGRDTTVVEETHSLLGVEYSVPEPELALRRAYRVFTTTIPLRNRRQL